MTKLLKDIAPIFVSELQQLLTKRGEADLAGRVPALKVIALCRCSCAFCASFYTVAPPASRAGLSCREIELAPALGMINLDVVGPDIVHVEVLYRDDVRHRIASAAPKAPERVVDEIPG
jgi:hypothetical protein